MVFLSVQPNRLDLTPKSECERAAPSDSSWSQKRRGMHLEASVRFGSLSRPEIGQQHWNRPDPWSGTEPSRIRIRIEVAAHVQAACQNGLCWGASHTRQMKTPNCPESSMKTPRLHSTPLGRPVNHANYLVVCLKFTIFYA